MLVFVCDTGGPASRLGIALLERLLDAQSLRLGLRGEVGRIRHAHGGGNALIVLDAPEEAIVSAANRSGRPILRFGETLAAAVDDLRAIHGVGFVEALRHATKLRACADGLHARHLPADTAAIAHALGLPAGEASATGGGLAPSFPLEALSMLEERFLAGLGGTPPVWPAGLFLQADAPGQAVEGSLDLVGPARLLAYGPYLHLGPGRWTLHAECAVSQNQSGNRLLLDMMSDGLTIGGTGVDLPAEGPCEIAFAFEIGEPRHALELYWRLAEGAIEGVLTIGAVRFASECP